MDQFHDRQHVRLEPRARLVPPRRLDHDGERVSLSRRRDSLHTAWAVHIHPRPDGPYLLLHNAAYGRYLGTTVKPAPLGHHGCLTEQRDYDDEPDLMAVMWKAAAAGFADVVLLRNVAGRFLRANGRGLPWNSGVTVDDNVSAMMYWTVEPIPARDGPPGLPGPIHTPSPGYHSLMLWRNPVVSRLIRFMPSDPNGPIYTQHCWTTFRFRGRSVFHLRDELARRIAFVLDGRQSFDLVMCVRAGRQGRLTPLVVDLPSTSYGETLWIVVFMSGTPVNLDELARRIAFVLDGRQSFDLVMCVQAGRQGRLIPLVVDLPSSGYGETLWIAAFMSGTPVNLGELARRIAFVLEASVPRPRNVRQSGPPGALTPLVVDLPSSGYGETHWIVVFMSGTPDVADVEMPLHTDYDRVDKSRRVDFALLPEEIICAIAQCAARCRCSVLAMRGVCRSWRYAVPYPTRAPLLILSSVRPDQPTLFLAVVAGSLLPQRNPLFLPPRGSRCWGSCNGLLGLRVAARPGLTLCPNCGPQYPLPGIHEDTNVNNFCETGQLVCTFAEHDPALTWWTKKGDEEHWSNFSHGFGIFPKSIYWDHEGSVACIAAAPSSLIVDTDFEQRLLPIPDGLQQELDDLGIELEHPAAHVIDFILEEDHLLEPWYTRGHHVFHVEQDVFMCILLRHRQNNSIHARLYVLNLDGHIASMIPADDIGNNALFLGGNQAFVTAAGPDLLPNTAYVVDDDGRVRAPQVVRINFSTGQSTIMEYPPDIGPMNSYMPPSWIDPLPAGHCT